MRECFNLKNAAVIARCVNENFTANWNEPGKRRETICDSINKHNLKIGKVTVKMEIPYGKVAVYALTFLAYAYSGYGSGLLSNLRDAVISAENIFGDVVKKAINVARGLKDINEFFDGFIDEHCVFKCPNNGIAKPNRNHRPSSNGCGALGLKLDKTFLPIAEMTSCCDHHDICYDTCNNDKELCDIEFRRCLYGFCDKYEEKLPPHVTRACKGAAKLLYTGTLAMGCKAYQDAQSKACFCFDPNDNKKKRKFTSGDGDL